MGETNSRLREVDLLNLIDPTIFEKTANEAKLMTDLLRNSVDPRIPFNRARNLARIMNANTILSESPEARFIDIGFFSLCKYISNLSEKSEAWIQLNEELLENFRLELAAAFETIIESFRSEDFEKICRALALCIQLVWRFTEDSVG